MWSAQAILLTDKDDLAGCHVYFLRFVGISLGFIIFLCTSDIKISDSLDVIFIIVTRGVIEYSGIELIVFLECFLIVKTAGRAVGLCRTGGKAMASMENLRIPLASGMVTRMIKVRGDQTFF